MDTRKSPKKLSPFLLLSLSLVGPFLVFTPATVSAKPSDCGSTIRHSITLTTDLGPCSGNGLIIGKSGTVLNCAGHTITGTPGRGSGIIIIGLQNVIVENCIVTGFAVDFYVQSSSSNILTGNMASSSLSTIGFQIISSSFNTLSGNEANSIGGSGFDLDFSSLKNNLTMNKANSGGPGFIVSGGSNILIGNSANSNRGFGFELAGSSNTLSRNAANGNTDSGFHLDSSSSANSLTGNTADSNVNYGYFDASVGPGTAGTANAYTGNECSFNGVAGSSPAGLCPSSVHNAHTFYLGSSVVGSCSGKCENLATSVGTADTTTSQLIDKTLGKYQVEPDIASSTAQGTPSTSTVSGYAWVYNTDLGGATIQSGTWTFDITLAVSSTSGAPAGSVWISIWNCNTNSLGSCTLLFKKWDNSTTPWSTTPTKYTFVTGTVGPFSNVHFIAVEYWISYALAGNTNSLTVTETTMSSASDVTTPGWNYARSLSVSLAPAGS